MVVQGEESFDESSGNEELELEQVEAVEWKENPLLAQDVNTTTSLKAVVSHDFASERWKSMRSNPYRLQFATSHASATRVQIQSVLVQNLDSEYHV